MSKRFNDYTNTELLAISNEEFNDAVRVEAIEQGVQPPITLSEAVRKSEWRGYQKPQESITVYEIVVSDKYGNQNATGIGYLDKALADAAITGIVSIENDTYSADKGYKIHNKGACVAQRLIGVSKSEQAWAKLEEYKQDETEFNKVMDACVERLSRVRQEAYDKNVRAEKKAEYLRLAGGDEAIAKGFWAKVERTEWPAE